MLEEFDETPIAFPETNRTAINEIFSLMSEISQKQTEIDSKEERINALKIKKNPYAIQSIKGLGFKSCDRIARNLNTALDSYERVRGGIIETINSHIQQTGDESALN